MAVCRRSRSGPGFQVTCVVLMLQATPVWAWQAEAIAVPELDMGFHLLYELKPEAARAQFAAWRVSHPEDPLGSAAEAASYLFEECYRQGVLTSEYFLDNKRFWERYRLSRTRGCAMPSSPRMYARKRWQSFDCRLTQMTSMPCSP